jgi:hypothetical protein
MRSTLAENYRRLKGAWKQEKLISKIRPCILMATSSGEK